MDVEEMRRIIYLLALLALAGCGAPLDGADGGGLAVRVKSAAAFDTTIEHGRVVSYRVIVEGEGIDVPIAAEFPGDAEEGVIEGVPAGEGRTVRVEAINGNGARIREGEAFGVRVGGGMNQVEVVLEAVPIFTNLAQGNAVENTRLVFKVFSDPANPVIVEEGSGGGVTALIDAATNVAELYLDQSTGTGRLAPVLMEPGERTFSVRDAVTGRSNSVGVRVVDGTAARPAPLVSLGIAEGDYFGCGGSNCAP